MVVYAVGDSRRFTRNKNTHDGSESKSLSGQ